jgi:hypothetical protein
MADRFYPGLTRPDAAADDRGKTVANTAGMPRQLRDLCHVVWTVPCYFCMDKRADRTSGLDD